MTRVSKAPDERRSELLMSAQALFLSKGYEKTSINDIVKQVGVAKGLFYYYFDSKQAILNELADTLAMQGILVMRKIVQDDSLPVLEKWRQAFQVTAAWKTARKEELLPLFEMMNRAENVQMYYQFRVRSQRLVAPELAKIIAQGVDEGVFDTVFVMDSAEIVISILNSVSDVLSDVLLHPDDYEDCFTTAKQKLNAIQDATERVLGAPRGSLPLMEDITLKEWFG